MKYVANKIKEEISKNNMNQKDFCRKFNFDEGNLSRTLGKSDENFINKELQKYANALGYDVRIILINKPK